MTEARPLVLHCVYSGLGGHAAVLFTLLNDETRRSFDHHVLFFGVEELCDDYVHACERLGVSFSYIRKKGRLAIRSHAALLKLIGDLRPDIIMINGTPLAVVVLGFRRLFRDRWTVLVRESQPNHQKTSIEWIGSYMAARSADAVVYLTAEFKSEVDERLRLSPQRRTAHVIPNGVDVEQFGVRTSRSDGPISLAMVGRLVPLKDHSTLVDAIRILVHERKHEGLQLFIAGDGPLRQELESQVRAARIAESVRFTGTLTKAAVADLLRTVDVYVHCTLGEGMSNSILQAMASGLPIVASDVRGVSNVIRPGEDGQLVPAGDARALADAIEVLIRSPAERERLAANARERAVAELSQDHMVERYQQLLRSLADARASG